VLEGRRSRELGAQNYNMIGRLNGKPAALVAVYQAPGANAVATAAGVRALMLEANSRFPEDLDYVVALDTPLSVTAGIKEIEHTLLEAIGLVILVVYIFLQGWRATLIPLLAVPVSLIGTFMIFPLLGFSINTLSPFGLVLAIGLAVDDAIVVVEAVEHHIEHDMTPHDATVKAMEEVGGPVIAIALILGAVFVPTAFIPSITGRLYQQFAVTIAVSVAFSAFNALTLSPALSAMVGPNYKRPVLATPDQYRDVAPDLSNQPGTQPFAEMEWETVFQDETLRALIKEALTNNYDVQIAATRILQAQAVVGITRANQLPQRLRLRRYQLSA
jgi:multidrug efflux pump subunit AcrB